jgi:SAM-dependent methyltransferase
LIEAGKMKNDVVQTQYEKWVYPEPVHDIAAVDLRDAFDPSLEKTHLAFWPGRTDWQNAHILVAGCGAHQAALVAYYNRGCHVTGIDVSSASLGHEERLKRKHGLSNLELAQMELEGASALGQEFDLIICVGVLHHIASPATGLLSLRRCLKPDGSIALMLYGKHRRHGVYMLQDLFRQMGLGQSEKDVEIVKKVLAKIPEGHLVRNYIRNAPDLMTDTGIIDTFLHRRDAAYSVNDCLQLLEGCDLVFQSWLPYVSHNYYPNIYVDSAHPLFQWAERIPEREIWAAMELFTGSLGNHAFIACRNDRPERTYRLEISGENLTYLVPNWTHCSYTEEAGIGTIKRKEFPNLSLNDWQSRIAAQFNGINSLAACFAQASPLEEAAAIEFVESLRRLGFVVFGIRP